ncbi:hypothetical protein [Enterococcus pallens]|uniref:Uncharacterized protein n=1 Tax=Enterococcus pallens ATCC BAA-351 TaxID=1158607 RepID=R2QI19_9ENTE|nr:hypothetical protein [Enterococcus pallens]EOH94833.1 hypothetical protein UAU_01755 [Enterococcus pallens ATCC BAA-351]EOU14848.1 hypothetical protein I588_04498 [Enterococcus pallens ATCC BAA-351]
MNGIFKLKANEGSVYEYYFATLDYSNQAPDNNWGILKIDFSNEKKPKTILKDFQSKECTDEFGIIHFGFGKLVSKIIEEGPVADFGFAVG